MAIKTTLKTKFSKDKLNKNIVFHSPFFHFLSPINVPKCSNINQIKNFSHSRYFSSLLPSKHNFAVKFQFFTNENGEFTNITNNFNHSNFNLNKRRKRRSQNNFLTSNTSNFSTNFLQPRFCSTQCFTNDLDNHEIQALMDEGVKPPQYIQYLEVSRNADPFDHKRLLYFSLKYKEATKVDLAANSQLQLRDLRSITRADANLRQIATIIVRRAAIVVHMGPLQAIIKKDRLLCFNLDHPLMRSLVKDFVLKINKTSPSNPIFEMRVLESLLVELMQFLEYSYGKIADKLTKLLDSLLISQTVEQLQSLLDYSIRLNDYHEGVLQIQSALNEILNSDEDMAMMYLSSDPPRSIDNHAEFEMLLEAFHHAVTEIDNRLKQYQNRIRVTEEYIKIHFEGQRNRLLRVSLIVSFATFATGVSAFGAGLFGMNLWNHVEQNPQMFSNVSLSLIAIGLSTFLASYSYYLSTKSSTTFSRLSKNDKMGAIKNWWETNNQHHQINKQQQQQQALQDEKNKKYYNYDQVGNINLAEIHHLQYFHMKELENEDNELKDQEGEHTFKF